MATDEDVEALEARVRDLHVQAQALNKQAGREGEATALYKQLAELDDEALELRLARARPAASATALALHAEQFAGYCRLHPPAPTWQQAASAGNCPERAQLLRQRALGAVLGSALADAAACGVQWVYSQAQLDSLAAGRPGLEFFDPPQCPFFDYPPGSSSPYGEQTRVLLSSLVEQRGLHCCRYAAALYSAFGPGYRGYRDRSTKSFLRRHAAGLLPPLTGSPDDQANCFTRLPPLVALHAGAGRRQLLTAVERMIRVTQDDDVAVAYGCAAALVLDGVVAGSSVAASVAEAVDWLEGMAHGGAAEAGEGGDCAVPAPLWDEVAARLRQAAELAPLSPLDAATRLGRNCHLPNSLQTPLQVLLHLERRHLSRQQAGALADGGSSPLDATTADQGQSFEGMPTAQPGEVARDDCLPCSMGQGSACRLPTPVARAGRASLAARAAEQRAWLATPATLPGGAAFVEAVRLALGPGGCCASRAAFVGSLAGAMLACGAEQLPADWVARMPGFTEVQQLAVRLVGLRDSSTDLRTCHP